MVQLELAYLHEIERLRAGGTDIFVADARTRLGHCAVHEGPCHPRPDSGITAVSHQTVTRRGCLCRRRRPSLVTNCHPRSTAVDPCSQRDGQRDPVVVAEPGQLVPRDGRNGEFVSTLDRSDRSCTQTVGFSRPPVQHELRPIGELVAGVRLRRRGRRCRSACGRAVRISPSRRTAAPRGDWCRRPSPCRPRTRRRR